MSMSMLLNFNYTGVTGRVVHSYKNQRICDSK